MTLPDTIERARQELELQITLSPALIAAKGFTSLDTERTCARARELCQQVGETPQLFSVLYGLVRFYMVRAELQTARELAEQLFSLAQRAQDPALLLEAHRVLGPTMFWLGELSLSRMHSEQGVALYDPKQHRSHAFVYGLDPGAVCRSYAAMSMWMLGYPDQAQQSSHKALTLAQEIDHPFSLAWTLAHATIVHQFRREAQTVQERAEALMTLSTEQGFPHWLPYGMILRGWARAEQGARAEGIAQLRQGLVAHLDTRAGLHRPYFLSLLAEAYGKGGKPEEGLTVIDEAMAIVNNTEERNWEAELHRLKGELLLMQQGQKVSEAEECFQQAFKIDSSQQAKSFELRVAMSLSRLWQQQGKRQEAHQLLSEIYGWFTEGFDTVDLQEAMALLEQLA